MHVEKVSWTYSILLSSLEIYIAEVWSLKRYLNIGKKNAFKHNWTASFNLNAYSGIIILMYNVGELV